VLVAYLENLALVAFIVVSKFLVNFHLFLLEAIGANNLGLLSFQMLDVGVGAFSYGGSIMHAPFEKLVERGVDQFQENI
jgi:hypothetical protein